MMMTTTMATRTPTGMWAVAALVLALPVTGCATKHDIRDLHDQMVELAARQDSLVRELRRQARVTQDTLRTQSDQLFDFRGEISRQLRTIAESLTTIEALAGENQRGIAGIRDQLANMRRMPARGVAGALNPQPGQAAPVAETGDAEALYNAAIEQFNRGQLATARQGFRQFVDAYPNHALAPDAYFYLADILAQDGKLDDAVQAFQAIGERFPESARVPDALYRVALIRIEQGKTDEARTILERIRNTYPDSGAAMLARDKLAEIR